MNHSFKNKLFVLVALLALIAGSFGVTPAKASITVTDGMAATLVLGQPNFISNTANNGGLSASSLSSPQGVTVDPATGKVFVSDSLNNRVLRFASLSSLTNNASAEAVFGQLDFVTNSSGTTATKMSSPQGLSVDSAGRLWVADAGNNRVLRFDNAATASNGPSADAVLGQANFTSNSAAVSATGFWLPTGVAVDSAGRLWVSEYNSNRVTRFDAAASKPNGGSADGVLGQADFTSSGYSTTATRMQYPTSVAVDTSGNLWVGDHNNRRALRFNNAAAKANGDPADVVLGQANFISAVPTTSQSTMIAGFGVAVDSVNDRLFVSSHVENRILVFNNASTLSNGANASNVIGQSNFTSIGAGVTPTALVSPNRIFFDPTTQTLLVADGGNHRVLMFGTLPPPAAPTVSTDSITTLSARNVNANISSLGFPASVTAHGIVYNTTGTPTTSDTTINHGNGVLGPYSIGLDEMNLTPGTKYYVRAFATNSTGTSYGQELVVYGVPGAFTVIAPTDGATDVPTSTTLSWNASTGATDYQYCVAADLADCAGDMFGPNWHATGGATSANVSGLLTSTNYAWAVRAVVGNPDPSYKWIDGAPFGFTTTSVASYTVTFDGNGSDGGSMSNQSDSAPAALTTNAFTRTGYTFAGWNTAADGSGTNYADGETYDFSADITLYAQWNASNPTTTSTFISNAVSDGQILETTETSGKGGSIDSTATRINLGDDAANKQYRAILSFDTSSIPDNAVITSVTLKFKYAGKTGTLPFNTHGNLMADIRKGSFTNNAALQTNDFKAATSKSNVLSFTNSVVNNWYLQSLDPANFQYINLTNVTQFRLRFQTDDNHDFGADLLKIYSGNAIASSRPRLIIEYYIP